MVTLKTLDASATGAVKVAVNVPVLLATVMPVEPIPPEKVPLLL